MINFIKKKFSNFILKTLYRYQHVYSPKFNTAFSNIYSIKNEDIDLLSDLKIDEKNYSTNSLISYVIREDTYSKNNSFILSLGHAKIIRHILITIIF